MEVLNTKNQEYSIAAKTIKTAILQSQYKAVKLINREQLALYFGIGRYISHHSRVGHWGTGAIAYISNKLQRELPGLRGFSERNLKNMRTFYEEWKVLDSSSAVVTADSQLIDSMKQETEEIRHLELPNFNDFPIEEFLRIGFTHHTVILSQVKSIEERFFYIKLCANELLKVDTLKKMIKDNVYQCRGTMPNNFIEKLPTYELAKKAIISFKDEYLLDFINVEELGARDIEDVDERIVENKIV